MDPLHIGLIALGGATAALAVASALLIRRAGSEAAGLRARLEAAAEERAAAQVSLSEANAKAARVDELKAELASERAMRAEADRRIAALDSRMRERESAVTAERERLTALSQEMQDRFKALADEALGKSQARFLERAADAFKTHQEKAEGGVKALVQPIRERLEDFKVKVEAIEKERLAHRTALGEQIRQLSQGLETQRAETSKLVNALQRSSTTRGQWGERTVENILELAGLTKGVDYDAQHQTRDSEGASLRPDFVVRLPGQGRFVIDSKVALSAYLDAVEAVDETARKEALERHARQVRAHVRQLSKKEYAAAVDGAIDFVALFIPGENFYAAALEHDPNLFDDAIAAGVIIVTPATLLALAKAVAYGWRQQALEDNAGKIAALGAEICDRLGVFAEHLGRAGSGLKSATANYNKAVASLEGRVLVSARKMAELNGASAKRLDAPEQVEETPRALAEPDRIDDASAPGGRS